MSLRRHILAALPLLALVLSGCPFRATPDYDGLARISRAPGHVVLSLGADAARERSVAWKTSHNVRASVLEYRSAADTSVPFVRIQGTSALRETEVEDYRAHEATISDLTPGDYVYRVGDGTPDGWSAQYTFTIPDPGRDTVRVAVLGDSRTYMDVWGAILVAAAAHKPEVILHTGDLVTDGNDLIHWFGWFAQTEGILSSIPFMPVAGNHEHASPDYFLSFALPENSTPELREEAFSFDLGPAHFVGLHSCRKLEQQTEWLEGHLRGASAPWKFVYYHRPAYGGTLLRGDGDKDIREAWAPIFDWFAVDATFQGHNHNYFRTRPIRNGETGDEGTVYITTGGAGAPLYPIQRNDWMGAGEKAYHYVILSISGDHATATAYRLDGSIIDRFTMTH